ncbi:trans-aconitate 2-methyltransferase [Saccharomonospora amisosensis]|uniref:Trans-aconitate 2-methyltransferase n=1 Tax=Saccharomonospora amisosensis TaxID=1128677 RepID=A0A7X5ZS87_9PSEU|nr:trans-aconitate 2-methyltransferase [Saccharomonospora amisosensis]NIJ13090.1 trans-aconitate 2-methyltransferase [Saccharomonospora amisosensis]
MWDPGKYLDYSEPRARPFFDLLARVAATRPRRVVDLGCGPGNLTQTLSRRWPQASVEAIDNSPEMVAAARRSGVKAEIADVAEWEPAADTDVVVCNAVLQWVPGHRELLRRWAGRLPSGAWLAAQLPGNFDAPSHTLPRQVARDPRWAPRLEGAPLLENDAVADPMEYAELFAELGCQVDAWETTYIQRLTGDDAVLEWVSGTALRPVRAALAEHEWVAFREQLAPLLAQAYPSRGDGTTWLPFRRVFVVACVP